MIADALAARIRNSGPISIADYMSAVAEAYYARGDVFGAKGDFITAPEISQIFGELIGLWCAVVWQNMGSPARFHLVECGPGRGTLMKDLLRAAARVPGFASSAQVHLVERSAALKTIQRATLTTQAVTWHDDILSVPPGPTILVANEFLDALPIHQIEMTAAGWRERCVGIDDKGAFQIVLNDGEPWGGPPASPGAIMEASPAILMFITQVSRRLLAAGGAALFIDYGHGASAFGETLQAVKKHKPCGLFETPGEADLTAHVDFDAVARSASAEGLKVHGPVPQGTWLARLGIKLRGLQLAKGKDAATAQSIESDIRRLTEAEAMGALFKVMALTHPALAMPEGFAQDAVL